MLLQLHNRHSAMFPQAAAEESHTEETATNIFILLVAVSAAVVAIAGFSVYLRYLRRTEDHDSRYLQYLKYVVKHKSAKLLCTLLNKS